MLWDSFFGFNQANASANGLQRIILLEFVKKNHIRRSSQRYHIISIFSNEKYKKTPHADCPRGSLRSSSLPGRRQDSDSLFIGSQGAKNAYNVLPKWNSNKICDIWDIYRLSTRIELILNIVLMVLCMFALPLLWNMIHVTPTDRRQHKMGGNSCGECPFPFYLVPVAITYSIAVVVPSCDVSFIKMTARGGSSKWIESTRVAHTHRVLHYSKVWLTDDDDDDDAKRENAWKDCVFCVELERWSHMNIYEWHWKSARCRRVVIVSYILFAPGQAIEGRKKGPRKNDVTRAARWPS